MAYPRHVQQSIVKEFLFQFLLVLLVFLFYAFDRRSTAIGADIQAWKVAFFLNYLLAALVIDYLLLPKLLYHKRYVAFVAAVLGLIALVIVVEEAILEQIYFPDTRGLRFPGIFRCLSDVLPVVAILAGFKFAWDALTRQHELEQLRSVVKESELQFLKSQIHPHFLFNNLNNLYAYALDNSPKTSDIILELSAVLRYMLYECQEAQVPLTREVEHLQHFVNLSRLQMEGRGTVDLQVSPVPESLLIAPLVLPVFVENAFKHSLSSDRDQVQIDIRLDVKDVDRLEFHCANTCSANSNTNDLASGIGLENVQKRLRLLYPNAHVLHTEQDEERYSVHLSLNLV